MTILTTEQFDEFSEAYPELAECVFIEEDPWDNFELDWETHA